MPAPLCNPPVLAPLAELGFFQWFREPASTGAADVDWLFYVITWICVVFFFPIVGLMGVFIARYYARPGHAAEHTSHHNNLLEATWSIVPGFIVIGIFYAGVVGYLDLRTPPEGAYEIEVVAKKWNWTFKYPNGAIDSNLHVPADQPVKLVMSSDDVLHSLYIPAFRVKMDCVPGRYSYVWFEATKPTESFDEDVDPFDTMNDENGYDLFCTEYCGQGHSAMIAKVIVHKSGTFESWLDDSLKIDPGTSPVELGRKLYTQRGCKACHSLDGSKMAGPSWMGTYGTEQVTDKGSVKVDENYIRESILNPMAKIRQGYKGVMPSYKGQLREGEIAALIWFMKSLKEGEQVPETWNDIGGVPGQEEKPEEGAEGEAAPETESPVEEPAEKKAA